MRKNQAKIESTKRNIVITIPISLLIYAIANKPDFPLKITDRTKFIEYIKKHIFEFGEDGESDVATIFYIFENLADDAFENGEEWLKEMEF